MRIHIPASRVSLGAGFVAYGLWAALHALGVVAWTAGHALSTYWPLLFALWGLLEALDDLLASGDIRHVRGWPLWVAVAALGLAGGQAGLFHLTAHLLWALFWAAVVVGIGLSLALRGVVPIIRVQGRSIRLGRADWSRRGASQMIGELHVGQGDPWQLTDRVYRQGMGDLTLDLTHARLREGETSIALYGGLGDIQVLVPPAFPVRLEGRVQVGAVTFFGRSSSGIDRHLEEESPGYAEAPRRLHIVMSMGMGDITVERVF